MNLRRAEREGTSYLIVDGWQLKDLNERTLRLVVCGGFLFSGLPAAYVYQKDKVRPIDDYKGNMYVLICMHIAPSFAQYHVIFR